MIKKTLLAGGALVSGLVLTVGLALAQSPTPTASPTVSPSPTASPRVSPMPTASPTVPTGAPATGMGY